MGKNNSQRQSTSRKPTAPSGADQAMPLGQGLAETAWRVAVPFLIFSLGGIWLDGTFESDPLFTVIGLILALAGVVVVMKRFVEKNYPDTFESTKGKSKDSQK